MSAPRDRTSAHSALVAEIRLALGGVEYGDLALWLSPNGDAVRWSARTASVTHAHLGLPVGSADLIGICRGRFVSLEVKTGKAVPSAEQKRWGVMVQGYGGFHAVVHSVAEALAAIDRCRAGAVG